METSDGSLGTDAFGCKNLWVKEKQTYLGIEQWWMGLQVHWCYSLGMVTSIEQTRLISCCAPLWSFAGWVTTDFPPAGGPSVRSFLQAQFKYSITWFGGSKTPWIVITVNGDGSYEWSWG
ncbi:MAG: hypothetical protein ACXVZ2_02865 [Gaiellaceae bacterium]